MAIVQEDVGLRPAYRFDDLEACRTALLVVDLQVVFVDEGQPAATPAARAIIPRVNDLVRAARDAGAQVVFIRNTRSDAEPYKLPAWHKTAAAAASLSPLLVPGASTHELHAGLDIDPRDWIVNKHRMGSFGPKSSDLHKRLQQAGIDTVIIAGAVTNYCCETTAREAAMLDYKTFFVSDATAAYNERDHEATLRNMTAMSDVANTDRLVRLLKESGLARDPSS